ncbi:RodZ domain-containing protein [Hwanghaeella sp.]|uniref:helix-turn-helix domain-containing protein n=1 Tax=Hwanghaeella sp. TaxID=2605943 RepID=UPI003CCBFDBC
MARGGAAKEAANDTHRAELKTVVDNRTVGEILSEARIARDMDYSDVAAQLRIRRAYIEAIEDGRLGDLPGSTYAIGFVRTYAELMDLDVPKIVSKFKQEAAEFEDRTQLVFPEPMPGSRGPTASVIMIAVLMLIGAYGGWIYVSNKDRDTLELVPPLPEALTQLLSKSTVETAPAGPSSEEAQGTAQVSTQETTVAPVPAAAETETSTVAQAPAEAAEQPTIVNETIASAPVTEAAQEEVRQAAETTSQAVSETVAAVTAETPAEAEVQSATETTTPEQSVPTTVVEAPAAVTEQAPVTEQVPATEPAAVETTTATTEAAAPASGSEATQAAASMQQTTEAAPVVTEPVQQAAVPETDTELPTVGGSQPAAFGAEAGASRIVIKATSPAWVEITAPDGNVLLNRLLRVGDTFNVPDQPGITLVTGSAGGLEFTVDGKIAPRIGDIGDVRRNVLLEPDALLQAQ